MKSKSSRLYLGLNHGYDLTGSGSTEDMRYIARGLARLGHDVHSRDREPASLPFVWTRKYVYTPTTNDLPRVTVYYHVSIC